jgi:DNA repair protein RecO (recombination protein O)
LVPSARTRTTSPSSVTPRCVSSLTRLQDNRQETQFALRHRRGCEINRNSVANDGKTHPGLAKTQECFDTLGVRGGLQMHGAGGMVMPARMSETYVLRTYPFRESDLIVSFFTRDQGKLRGVARRAKRPKSNFGSGLERLSLVNLSYSQKETRELVDLNSCDLVQSQFDLLSDFEAGVALDFVAEVSEHMLPPHEANERFFRLLTATLDYMRTKQPGCFWQAITYFSLWATRLSGFLPDLGGAEVTTRAGRRISDDSVRLAALMLRHHLTDLPARTWTKDTALDLRRFLIREMEEHVERRFLTPGMLEAL